MSKSLTIIIPVSASDSSKVVRSIDNFKWIDFTGFDERIVYAIDLPPDTKPYYQNLKLPENTEILWVTDNSLKQASAYNAVLNKYPDSDFYSFFDIDAVPAFNFFKECYDIDADFVSCDRQVSNTYRHIYIFNIFSTRQNSMSETISEEYEFCNLGRETMYRLTGKFFPASCTGLVHRRVFNNFRFTERTSADSELYRHILYNDFTMALTPYTYYAEDAPTTMKELYSQRLRWLSDTWRTFFKTVGSGNTWKINIVNMLMYLVGMFPILGIIALLPYATHIKGYNFILHSVLMQYISLVALIKTIKRDSVEWV